jgi:hypothetical protein
MRKATLKSTRPASLTLNESRMKLNMGDVLDGLRPPIWSTLRARP